MYPTEAVVIEKLTKVFNDRLKTVIALENLDLSVKEGEFLCIVGPSGCGKTTLLRILVGLENNPEERLLYELKIQKTSYINGFSG